MKILISKNQYWALMDIYGPPENVHLMIMTARQHDGKYSIEGDEDDFEDLLRLISEELGEGLCSKKNISALVGICKRVDPASLDWIGQ
jgi:hypothetical protein